ncbi:hypothetical protein KIPB_011567 [Kipferlia bialata]|uniref:Rab-GAP TBC domain-containing protein n=1 Tax=Kipferlia bialata TaxID=797122 RepID=A0A9K3D5B3_9EUKA|nr:hypothetical protein KIPB_011567 [Kipferlia bialata]|eukprot:g11567.t1
MPSSEFLIKKYNQLLAPSCERPVADRLALLRTVVLQYGIPDEVAMQSEQKVAVCSLRGRLWKAFLGVGHMDPERYLKLVAKGPSAQFDKIGQDTFRTFANNRVFTSAVPEEKLIRLLNAYVHASGKPDTYVQGMNVLAAPLLFVLPEVDAFHCFEAMGERSFPTYLRPNCEGALAGTRLVDQILKYV